MISYFNSITVPGLEHITMFRDDEDPWQFYALPSTPRLARDDAGHLLLDLIVYARDVDKLKPEDLEAQRGWLAASVELQLSPDEHERILAYLRDTMRNSGLFLRILSLDLGANREPKLTLPPQFVDGSVTLTVPNPGGAVPLGTSKPSLISTNLATISGDLSQDSSELIRQAVLKGGLPLAASYELSFLARIPSIKVHIHGERSAFLSETITRYKSVQTVYHENTWAWWWWGFFPWVYRWTEEVATTNTSITTFQNTVQTITLDIDDSDFRDDPEAVAAKKEFESMAIKIFSDNVVPSIMKDVSDQLAEAQKRLGPAPDPNKPDAQTYGTDSLSTTIQGSIDIHLQKSSVIQVRKNPNGALSKDLTPDQIANAITYLDLGDPYYKELPVRVHANVNFAQDPVYGLKVFLDYDQTDDRIPRPVKGSKTMLFTSAEQVQTFRQVMARDAEGRPKDSYSYWSEIIYKETGQTIRVPAGGSLTSRETELVISYRSLGFIKVNLALAPMPDEVVSVDVAIRYPRSTLPSASQKLTLTRSSPTAVFFTYTGHEGDPDPYRYALTYVLTDGQRMDVPERQERAEMLSISNPFEDTVTTTFLGQGDFSQISRIIIDAKYVDEANDLTVDHHAELKANGDSNSWTFGLRDPKRLEFDYTTTLVYVNGSSPPPRLSHGVLGGTVVVGRGAVDALTVSVVSTVDWNVYSSAVVQLEYRDDASSVRKTATFRLSPTGSDAEFTVPLADPAKTGYRYRIVLISGEPAKNYDSGWQDGSDTLLLVGAPAGAAPAAGPNP